MTTEQQLAAIIEAQGFSFPKAVAQDIINDKADVLAQLLDPQGLRAAYPGIAGEARMSLVLAAILQNVTNGQIVTNANLAAYLILDTWLSSNGDATATIQTAYDLLPKHV